MVMFYAKTVEQVCFNEKQEFSALFSSYAKKVYNLAYRLCNNKDEAQDLTQEAFIRAFKAFKSYNPTASPDRWLYKIVTNVYLDSLRKKKKYIVESLDEDIETPDGQVTREIGDFSLSPEHIVERDELKRVIQKALQLLPLEYRAAVVLADLQGFSYEEIGDILNCSLGTVRSRIHRGRKILREKLSNYIKAGN